jgi:hypothetical protein
MQRGRSVRDEGNRLPIGDVGVATDDHCGSCTQLVGRAGRTNEEILAAVSRDEFMSKIVAWDYKFDPPVPTVYCPPCFKKRVAK